MGHSGPELALGGKSWALNLQMGLQGAKVGPQESLDGAMELGSGLARLGLGIRAINHAVA